jgi:DNA-binding transcriptional ArsR family regulator
MNKQNMMLDLDPIFETLGLLFITNNLHKQHKDKLIEELDKFMINGEEFYNKHLRYLEKYIHSFNSHKIPHELDHFFFGQEEYELSFLFACLLGMNKHWFQTSSQGSQLHSEHEIRLQLLNSLIEEQSSNDPLSSPLVESKIGDLSYMITYLNQTTLNESVKWKLMMVLERPKYYMNELIHLVQRNLPAFEQAKQDIDKTLQKMLKNYEKMIVNGNFGPLNFANLLAEKKVIFPTLIMPLVTFEISNLCYCGLQVYLLPAFKKNAKQSNELLQIRLKALSDQSKLQIMHSLKSSPKYNLEIAEQLGLTAATTSHHMNVLQVCKLVKIEKKSGKVYYTVDTESVEQFVKELETFLL